MSVLETETLYYGDCLDWMQRWDDASVDLIYLDPPFNSKTNYNILYSAEGGADAQYRAFTDTWAWDEAAAVRFAAFEGAVGRPAHSAIVGLHRILGPSGMLAYLTYMAERLEQMKRILRPTGSIYLHCDPTASHYLKVLMDVIFGHRNFLNEIIWSYRRWPSTSRHFQTMHDVILFYSRGDNTFHVDYEPPSPSYLKRFKGKTQILDPETKSRKLVVDKPTKGMPQRDVWDLSIIAGSAKERLGYPTQKPVALLNRILKASSNEGDVVLDPFCGCGTTIDSARRLNRRWAGIDISSFAIDLIKSKRLRDCAIPTKGIPTDLASARKLASEQPFSFESWAVTRLPGFAPNTKQVGDGGVDGRATLAKKPDNYNSRLALAQIKGGQFSLSALRDFIGVTTQSKAALGCYVTLDHTGTPAAKATIANMGKIRVSGYPYPKMQLWPISHYFEQRMPHMPIMNDPYSGKPMDQMTLF